MSCLDRTKTWLQATCCGGVLSLLLLAAGAKADVTVEGMRVIYAAGQREVALRQNNEAGRASLVQAWVSDGNLQQTPEASNAPFVLDRPILRWIRRHRMHRG